VRACMRRFCTHVGGWAGGRGCIEHVVACGGTPFSVLHGALYPAVRTCIKHMGRLARTRPLALGPCRNPSLPPSVHPSVRRVPVTCTHAPARVLPHVCVCRGRGASPAATAVVLACAPDRQQAPLPPPPVFALLLPWQHQRPAGRHAGAPGLRDLRQRR